MPNSSPVTIVCLPQATPVDAFESTAAALLPDASAPSLVSHFRTSRRLFTGKLLHASKHTAAGGPLGLLDLDAMAAAGRTSYYHRCVVWHQVTTQTKAAQPFWTFLDRHQADPKKYSLQQAQQGYLAQPRIAAMRTYNLLPNRVMDLPTDHLEAFQAGLDTYTHLGGLTAVPANSLITATGKHLKPATGRLSDLLAFLDQATPTCGPSPPPTRSSPSPATDPSSCERRIGISRFAFRRLHPHSHPLVGKELSSCPPSETSSTSSHDRDTASTTSRTRSGSRY
jgi:hypothetical protein